MTGRVPKTEIELVDYKDVNNIQVPVPAQPIPVAEKIIELEDEHAELNQVSRSSKIAIYRDFKQKMAKILAQSKVFIDQRDIKNQQNEQKAKKMQETSAALQKAAVPAFSSEPETTKTGNGTENCDVQVETVASESRSGESGEQATAESNNKTQNSNCSIRKRENSDKKSLLALRRRIFEL